MTALHVAAATDHPECLAALLEAGADINGKSPVSAPPAAAAGPHTSPPSCWRLVHPTHSRGRPYR